MVGLELESRRKFCVGARYCRLTRLPLLAKGKARSSTLVGEIDAQAAKPLVRLVRAHGFGKCIQRAGQHRVPVVLRDPYHQPHLQNFFQAIRGKEKLNCPAEIGYETAVTVLKINEAVEKGCKMEFKAEDFQV